MKKEGIVREIYLRSEPSIDLDLVTEAKSVDCTKHTLKMSVYDAILEEYCEDQDERTAVNMFMVMSGPQLVQG